MPTQIGEFYVIFTPICFRMTPKMFPGGINGTGLWGLTQPPGLDAIKIHVN